jgi:hypothetical protein
VAAQALVLEVQYTLQEVWVLLLVEISCLQLEQAMNYQVMLAFYLREGSIRQGQLYYAQAQVKEATQALFKYHLVARW